MSSHPHSPHDPNPRRSSAGQGSGRGSSPLNQVPLEQVQAEQVQALLDRYWAGQSSLEEEAQLALWAEALSGIQSPEAHGASDWPEELVLELRAAGRTLQAGTLLAQEEVSGDFDRRFWAAAGEASMEASDMGSNKSADGLQPKGKILPLHGRTATRSGASFRQWMGRAAVLLIMAAAAFALLRPGTLESLYPSRVAQNSPVHGGGTVLAYAEPGQEAEALEQAMSALLLVGEKLNVANRQTARIGVINTAIESYASPADLVRKAIAGEAE